MKKRIRQTVKATKKNKLDGILISNVFNIKYLTGIKNIEGYLFLIPEKNILFTDFRYKTSSLEICKKNNINIVIYKNNIYSLMAQKIKKTGAHKVGFESNNICFRTYRKLHENFSKQKIELIPTQGIIEKVREIKDKSEIKLINESVKITKKAISYAWEISYPGLSEKYISAEIEKLLKILGDNTLAFSTIVASGKSSGEPHHIPSDKKISSKKPVLIDLGSKYKGYCADLTRILFLSKMPLYIKKIYDIVKKAKEKSIKKIKAGRKISDIDKAARSYIDKKGYGKYFGHAVGHGVGLNVHERPFIQNNNNETLKENSIITIEPAIYLPGKFGIREESMVQVTKNGAEVLDEYK